MRRAAAVTQMSPPTISVVIPTYNRLDRLKRVLAALAQQTADRSSYEVVVVSDGSTDGTDDYLAGLRGPLRLVVGAQPNGGPAAARNLGIKLASAPLVFVDDDVVADPELILRHQSRHAELGPDHVVIGPMLSPADMRLSPWVRWEQEMLYKQYEAMRVGSYSASFRQFFTGNASVPRARLLECGGFDPQFRRAEDVELGHRLSRAGLAFAFDASAIGYHYAERTFDSWLRNAREYGRNDVVFAKEKDRDPDLRMMAREFSSRHRIVRSTTSIAVRHPGATHLAVTPLRRAALAFDRVRLYSLSRASLSVLYHMEYYRGVSEGLGGLQRFRETVVNVSRRRAS
jgi:GT2 family glycosyltransferase